MSAGWLHEEVLSADTTMVRPDRRGQDDAAQPPPTAAANEGIHAGEPIPDGMSPLLRAASPLLLLSAQLRHGTAPPDPARLHAQAVAQIHRFERRARAAGVGSQSVVAARYLLCAVLDEAVLNAAWGERSGWSRKTLLASFHGETYGGEKFFLILERLCADPARHIDLLEMMYTCLALGFGGRYEAEAGGRAKLAGLREELYRRIRAQRAPAAEPPAPRRPVSRSRRHATLRYLPLGMAAGAACVLLAAFLYLRAQLDAVSMRLTAQTARIGLEPAVPPAAAARPTPRGTLETLLAPDVDAGLLWMEPQADGQVKLRLRAPALFPSGSADIAPEQLSLLRRVAQALNQVPGRVVVVGHADNQPMRVPSFAHNQNLSMARARAVMQILRRQLDDPARIESIGVGDAQPIALPANLPANRVRNRRVEILYLPEVVR